MLCSPSTSVLCQMNVNAANHTRRPPCLSHIKPARQGSAGGTNYSFSWERRTFWAVDCLYIRYLTLPSYLHHHAVVALFYLLGTAPCSLLPQHSAAGCTYYILLTHTHLMCYITCMDIHSIMITPRGRGREKSSRTLRPGGPHRSGAFLHTPGVLWWRRRRHRGSYCYTMYSHERRQKTHTYVGILFCTRD